MFELIDGIRKMKQDGSRIRVLLFDAADGIGGRQREREMAGNLARAADASPEAMLIALTGNRHSRITRGSPQSAEFEPMGHLLGLSTSFDDLVALHMAHGGGDAWVCAPDCGLVKLDVETARAKLAAMVEGARLARDQYDN